MPSKVTGAARTRRTRERRAAEGLGQLTVMIPVHRREEMRDLAAAWTAQHRADRIRERGDRDAPGQHPLPL